MPNAAKSPAETRGWFAPALLVALAVTTFRIALLAANRTDLFVDEAQYWLWGQELAFGYYSKPPLIGWAIRAATEIGGSDASFWVRIPGPLLHCVTGLLLAAIAAPRFGKQAAIWVCATYVTLPMVAIGSLMISTDTVMVPFLVLSLLAWMRGLDVGGSHRWAILAGLSLGIGFLGKYAAVYFIICAGLSAALLWQARPGWKPAASGFAAFLLAISPNILWNLANGLSTVEHTLDNADWVRNPGDNATLNFVGLAEFLGSQFAVFGPILFACLLYLAARPRRISAEQKFLLLFSLPILAIVSVQALLSQAYANWAATAYIAGTLLVVPWLLTNRPGLLKVSMGIHLLLAVLLPVLTVFGTGLRLGADGELLLARYLGRSDMSQSILEAAKTRGVRAIVADDRDVLADLFYFNKDGPIAVYARPVSGRAPNHYVLKHSMPSDLTEPVLFVSKQKNAPNECTESVSLGRIAPQNGAYAHRSQKLFLVDAQCLVARPGN
ncbi:ArnT family glycosyltransferase [Aliiruegeria lutimaris]|uniref:4-amino-4-deoxy-L-arabinose transferase n=1 Tax=Aliiruegeria lutimaris TaxID=571298 RepID=A0A1G8M3Z6_9RHOB|nr:glycosyltransferase family 39 protein [Aliiruegeria lutimaris]SDI62527.1 4-amino-4-deoxy-L-arabinose transferase [Aliiruegeria lutimaris]